ncbi:MAG: S41 family peptidase [Dongiales bacterium]
MSLASGRFSLGRRLATLLLFMAVAGCSTASSPLAANSDYDRDLRMFTSAYEDIDDLYIRKVDLENLALGGLSGLAAIDPDIAAKRNGDKIDILYKDETAAGLPIGDKFAADDWAALTAAGIAAARQASPLLAKADSEAIYKAVINGMLARLNDPFSRYAGRDQAADNRASREGFGGIGVILSVDEGTARIVSVQHYLPAERAGLRPDDIITAVNGVATKGLDQQQVVSLLRGSVDSRVLLTIQRKSLDHPLVVALTRVLVVPETVTYRREGDIAYFRIYQFNEDTTASLRREFENAHNEIGNSMRGVILDLRGDPGGVLDQAVGVADLFMDSGRIVSTIGRNPDSHQYYEATPGDIAQGLPIAILINGNSASASEIVAAALQDSGRAVLIGTNSYGKGTVQTVPRLPNNGEISLTWARYFAPSGYTLNHIGVLPSICTNNGDQDATELLAELGDGKLNAVPVKARNTTSPEDTPALDKLRATCPAYKSAERAVDLQVAIRLLSQPRLYAEALALAAVPGQTATTQSALTQEQIRP